MKNKSLKLTLALLFVVGIPLIAAAQEESYKFTIDKELTRTSVKSQINGTCWCYATLSMIESEVIRTQNKQIDLSEMYLVCKLLPEKASNYVRLGGKTVVGHEGLGHHVTESWKKYGLMPDQAFPHVNTAALLNDLVNREETGLLQERVKSREGYTPEFNAEVEALIEKHVGKIPEKFTYQGKEYTPQTFADEVVKLNPDDYVEITSYNHHPFYEQFRLEIPDNWDFDSGFYNIPLDEMEQIVDYSIENGYTVMWDGDVGRRGKVSVSGVYHVPVDGPEGEKLPAQQKVVTQSIRPRSFATFDTTDVHLMHLVGIAHDQNHQKFYLIKNSHGTGTRSGPYQGNVYMSQAFFRLDTTSIAVNRNAIPPEIRQKMGIRIRGAGSGGRIRD